MPVPAVFVQIAYHCLQIALEEAVAYSGDEQPRNGGAQADARKHHHSVSCGFGHNPPQDGPVQSHLLVCNPSP